MSIKRIFRHFCLVAWIGSGALASEANAQASGSTTLGLGWLHIMPQGGSGPLTVESISGAPINQSISGTGARAGVSNAIGVTTEHMFTDHIGVAFLGGMPFTNDLIGTGSLASYGVIGKAKPMAPILEVRYHLFPAGSKFRPFIGAGVNYTWYSNTRITNGRFLNDTCGPGCSAQASLSSSWNPAFELGLNYAMTKHWAIDAFVSYIPISTTLTTNVRTAEGTDVVTKLHIRTNPVITHLDLAYTF
ncbi:outer membrane beta-barrel protein [Burkholderia contaminans]|nr:outer membrane beta-barrel protein [Burkholderia contaminans]